MICSLLSAKWYPLLFDSPLNAARAVFFWLTVALVLSLIIFLVLRRKSVGKRFMKVCLIVCIAWAAIVGVTLLTLTFRENGIKAILFAPLLTLILSLALSMSAIALHRSKPIIISGGALIGAAMLTVFICMGIYYASGEAESANGVNITLSENVLLYLFAFALLALIISIALIFGRMDRRGFDSKSIAYAAVCIAMSFALSYLRFIKLPQGGSVTVASLFPLMLYSYMFGTRKGVFVGFIYGVLQALQDPWIVHPAQFMLDYPVAFAAIGLAGTFNRIQGLNKLPQVQFVFGALVGGTLRYVCHLLSGVFAFSEYAYNSLGNPMNAWIYSLAYNSFVFVDLAIAIVVGVAILSSRAFVRQIRKLNPQKTPVNKTNDTEA